MSTNITEGLNKMKAGPVILLVAIVLHKGLNSAIGDSCKFYRYNGTVLITERPNTYSVKLCSLDINQSTCEVDTEAADCDDHQLNMCKLCDNPSGNNPSMCQIKLCRQSQGPPLLITNPAMNCSITPTESTTEYTITTTITAIQSSLVDTTSTLCRVCSNTHTTTVYISSSVAPTLSMNKNSTTTTQISQTVLGAMLGIFGILLAIVSTGWVCTCWAMKKRRQKKNINTGNIRYSEMQAIDGNNTTPPLRDQPHNNNPNTMNLRQNQAYGTQPKETSHDSNTDREYEVIPPLAQEIVTNDDSRVQGNQTVTGTQPHQPMSPGQPNEEIEHSRMHPGQEMTEGDEHKDSTGNENVYTLEPKAEDDEDKMAAPYEIPVPTKIKK